MSEQYLNNFWNKCEDQLKYYTTLFNIDMCSKGFKIQYKVLDKTPIGICYTLIMTYQQHTAQLSRCTSHLYACTPRNCF